MSPDPRKVAGLALVGLMVVVAALAYPQLPDRLAIRFDTGSRPDGFLTQPLGLAVAPLVGLAVVALFEVLPWLDPLGENVADFQRYYDLVAVTAVGPVAYVQWILWYGTSATPFPSRR